MSRSARPAARRATARCRSTCQRAPSRSQTSPLKSAAPTPVSVKIASITASGTRQPDAARFAADTIEVSGIEVDWGDGRRAGRARHLQGAADYRERLFRSRQPAAAATGFVVHHRRLPIRARAIRTRQRVVGHGPHPCRDHALGGAMPTGGDFTYSGLSKFQGIKDGKIAAMKVDGLVIHGQDTAGRAGQDSPAHSQTSPPMISTPSRSLPCSIRRRRMTTSTHRVYRQISTGAYTHRRRTGLRVRVDGITVDDVAMRPSRLQLPALLAIIPPAGTVPTPAQARGPDRQGRRAL